ncbi:MAG: helix-turn-helix domain-containing protein [Desmonostoc vinosum HA7617-LM4]|jgi:putative transposase|nr:helix-turn-helix domain-containing protein [Desmonostoc vinosum HA7617-LM4]
MKISYQYKIKPNKEQAKKIEKTLDMLRCQYNYLLAERFDWYEQNRCSVDRCPLICHLPELKEQPNYYNQKASLVQLKIDRPWYKDVHSQVLQEVPKKVELAFDRWLKGDVNGKKSGKPRFKGKCSNCGHKVKKPLSQRIHNCTICHVNLCRDLNAAINIKARGTHALKAQLMSS